MWTPAALSSEAKPYSGDIWRVVEAQSRASTMRITDTLDEQAVLEGLIEEVKPAMSSDCAHLHWLLSAPFRYGPYPHGSRFRRVDQQEGVYYAGETVETAVAEIAFYRLLFFAESPGTKLPDRPVEHTAFSVRCRAKLAIDLSKPPLDRDSAIWTHPVDRGPCQDLADSARQAAIEAIRYRSVRDPDDGMNVALLSPRAFAASRPRTMQTWRLYVRPHSVQAWCEYPPSAKEYGVDHFRRDPRLASLLD
jgi:hypothetical protein